MSLERKVETQLWRISEALIRKADFLLKQRGVTQVSQTRQLHESIYVS